MIEPTAALADLEARYQREMWAEAAALGVQLGANWRDDLDADLAVARAAN